MPLVVNRKLDAETFLGVWHLTETAGEIKQIDSSSARLWHNYESVYSSEHRIKEKVLARILLKILYSTFLNTDADSKEVPEISYNEDGCPRLDDGVNISISHTTDYVAVIISTGHIVGVDIEMRGERVNKIAKRFIREDEHADTTGERLLIWCAKETMYKMFSSEHLGYFDMRTANIKDSDGVFVIENIKKNLRLNVNYHLGADYVMTYSIF